MHLANLQKPEEVTSEQDADGDGDPNNEIPYTNAGSLSGDLSNLLSPFGTVVSRTGNFMQIDASGNLAPISASAVHANTSPVCEPPSAILLADAMELSCVKYSTKLQRKRMELMRFCFRQMELHLILLHGLFL